MRRSRTSTLSNDLQPGYLVSNQAVSSGCIGPARRCLSPAARLLRTGRARFQAKVLDARIRLKWISDRRRLPLTENHWELYANCHRASWRELQDLPNLVNPRDFNDRIQWLKLFDQTEEHVRCSDKIRVRDYVRERVGNKYLVQLYQTCDSFDKIEFDRLPKSFVIKTNHDSGGVVLVRNKDEFDKAAARERIESSLQQTYGWENGEWAYAFVQPRVLVEEFIDPETNISPADFKFYVVNGVVKFMHYISERGSMTKEQTISPEGEDLATSLYPSFRLANSFQKPGCWQEMKDVAEQLGSGFKCVRVDLFHHQGCIYAGELTFWPMYGCYKGEGQKVLGQLLDFDRTTFKPPIYQQLRR